MFSFRKEFLTDDMHINVAGSNSILLEGDQGDGGRSSGAPFKNTPSGLSSVCIWAATVRPGSADGRTTFQTARWVPPDRSLSASTACNRNENHRNESAKMTTALDVNENSLVEEFCQIASNPHIQPGIIKNNQIFYSFACGLMWISAMCFTGYYQIIQISVLYCHGNETITFV